MKLWRGIGCILLATVIVTIYNLAAILFDGQLHLLGINVALLQISGTVLVMMSFFAGAFVPWLLRCPECSKEFAYGFMIVVKAGGLSNIDASASSDLIWGTVALALGVYLKTRVG